MEQPTEEMIALAMEKLGIDEAMARSTATRVPAIEGAYCFSRGVRGGGRLIVSSGLETLFAASSVTPDQHAAAFLKGLRSDG